MNYVKFGHVAQIFFKKNADSIFGNPKPLLLFAFWTRFSSKKVVLPHPPPATFHSPTNCFSFLPKADDVPETNDCRSPSPLVWSVPIAFGSSSLNFFCISLMASCRGVPCDDVEPPHAMMLCLCRSATYRSSMALFCSQSRPPADLNAH
jgi:hypothetical protein